PTAAPIKMSEGKCWLAVMREKLTSEASPYAPHVVTGPGYSRAITAAALQAIAACSEGNDEFNEVPCQKRPDADSVSGLARWVANFSPSPARAESVRASAVRIPVSRACSFRVILPITK